LTTPRSQDGALKPASAVLSAGFRSLGSCPRAAGWSAATLCLGTKQPTFDVRRSVAKGAKPDITRTAQSGREWTQTGHERGAPRGFENGGLFLGRTQAIEKVSDEPRDTCVI